MFYENFIRLCTKTGKSPTAIAEEIGLNRSTVTGWKKRGSLPSDATAQKLADYFGVTVAELMAEEKEPAPMDGLTEEEARFLEKLRKASPEIQQAVMAVLRSAEK